MANPADKSAAIFDALELMSNIMSGRSRSESIKADVCSDCGGDASTFNDAASRKEYTLTGWCQSCQINFFGE